MGYQYSLMVIDKWSDKTVSVESKSWWSKEKTTTSHRESFQNPDWIALFEGNYVPPVGSRVVSIDIFSADTIYLLLELEVADGHPYRGV